MNGNKLTDHLQEVEQAAERYMDTLLPQLMKVSKITERRSKANSDGTRIGFAFCSILIISLLTSTPVTGTSFIVLLLLWDGDSSVTEINRLARDAGNRPAEPNQLNH